MRLQRQLTILGIVACGFLAHTAAALSVGADREAVLAELGKPTSAAKLGNREILTYPNKIRIELIDGRVAKTEGIVVDDSPAPPSAPSAVAVAEPESAPAPKTPPVAATTAPATKARTPAVSSPPPASKATPPKKTMDEDEDDAADAGNPVASLGDFLENDEKQREKQAVREKAEKERLAAMRIPMLLGELALHLIVTCLALKLAFKIWELDAFFTGYLAIAGIDFGLRLAMELAGPVTGGLSEWPSLQAGVSGLVLIFTIRRFCFNKDWFAAVRAAAIVKIATFFFWMFAAMAILKMVSLA